MPFYTANQADTGRRRGVRACDHGSQQLLQHQRHAAGAAVLEGDPRTTRRRTSRRTCTASSSSGCPGTSTSTATTASPTTTSSSSTGTPTTQTLGRSGIHHDVLGSYNWMVFQDIAGLQPRLDDTRRAVADRHGLRPLRRQQPELPRQRPDDRLAEAGRHGALSAGAGRLLAVRRRQARPSPSIDLAHVTWNSATRSGRRARRQRRERRVPRRALARRRHRGQPDRQPPGRRGVPEGRRRPLPAAAAPARRRTWRWAPRPRRRSRRPAPPRRRPTRRTRSTASRSAACRSRPGRTSATNPIWGTRGSPNAQDWLQVDLGKPTTLDTVKLYFY